MSGLPAGWALASVGDLVERVEAGLNVKCIERPPEPGERGLVKISAVTSGRFEQDKSKTLPKGIEVDDRNRIAPGDLLFSRANTIELVGACALVDRVDRTLYLSDKVLRLVAPLKTKRWLNLALKTPDARRAIAEASSGNQLSMRNIAQDRLRALPVPVAPLAEQQRIADKLEAVLGRVDACRDRLDRVGPLLQRFRQSVLAAAMSGDLTAAWRDSSTKAKWHETTLGELAEVGTGSTPLRSKAAYFADQGTPWITSSATSRQFIVAADQYVTNEAIKAHRLRVYPPGTLLVAMYGEGKTRGQVAELSIHATINQACAAIIVNDPAVSKDFIKLALRANYLAMRKLAEGGNQPNLNLSKVRSVPLLLPGIAEQAELIRRVNQLFGLADRLENRLATALTTAGRLTPALLAKAFRGELVPQDPTDEPAQALLDRLRAAKATEPSGRRRRQPAGA